MNQRSDIDRLLRHWMDDGPSTMPDRVIDVVADQISVQRQRRSWRLLWRLPMSPIVKLGAAVAAVLVVAVVAWQVLPGQGGTGGAPTASPPVVTPSIQTATPSPIPRLPEGTLGAGSYRLSPLASVPGLHVDATVPAGWKGFGGWAILGPAGTESPGGTGIAFIAASGLYSDPCHWHAALGDGDVEVGPTVDDLVAALTAQTAYESTTPTDVTLGGFAGKQLDLQLATDITGCDVLDGEGRYFVFGGPEPPYAQGPANRWSVSIVDVAGTRLIAVLTSYAGTPEADLSAAQAILDSLVITP